MTITRVINGAEVQIDLTEKELYSAYLEQKRILDLEDCKYYIEYKSEDSGEDYEQILLDSYDSMEDALDDMVEELEECLMGNDVSRSDALEWALDRLI